MARFPAHPKSWSMQPYGSDAAAWDDAKRQCRDLLYKWAAAERYGTYSELAQQVTAIDWPEGAYTHHGRQMGYLLGQVSLEELDRYEDRPVLSALVIGQDEGMPSHGFWNFVADELGIDVPATDLARLSFWVAEFKAACRYYGRVASQRDEASHSGKLRVQMRVRRIPQPRKSPDSRSESGLDDEVGTAYRIPSEMSHASQPRTRSASKRRMRRMRHDP